MHITSRVVPSPFTLTSTHSHLKYKTHTALFAADTQDFPTTSTTTSPSPPISTSSAPAPAPLADLTHSLSFLWLDKTIGVAVDQVFTKGSRSPITEYFFWPRVDAWEELKAALDSKSWFDQREKVLILNRCTEVINYWQDGDAKHSIDEVKQKFPDCKFQGS